MAAQSPGPARKPPPSFQRTVRPFLAKNCLFCHNAKLKTGNLNLEAYHTATEALQAREIWERVVQKLRAGEMPPEGRPRPNPAQVKAVTRWIETQYARIDRRSQPDPGRVTARRLNRVEYNNTIRDLLAVEFRPADDFPADDAGYGFDNIGDVLSLSPVLMEKYLAAAEKIARMAIVADPPMKPTRERYPAERLQQAAGGRPDGRVAGNVALSSPGAAQTRHRFPVDAEYDLRVGLGGRRLEGLPPLKVAIWLDGRQARVFEVEAGQNKPRAFDARVHVKAGEHQVAAAFLKDPTQPEEPDHTNRERNLVVDYLEIRGPFELQPPSPESYKRIFTCGHPNGSHQPGCARKILTDLARRAYRRPVTEKEVDALTRFVALAEKEGESFEQGIRLALQAALVSPHFLFRIERDPEPTNPGAVHLISQHELASRLSYFLWSSMPDGELFRLADEQRLRKPGVLPAQVRRMLLDPKSRALADNFAGQWLQIRNLESVKPDPDRFPAFDDELREAMLRETKLFFAAMVREDRSILDFIDGRFTFLNERLARHYGIAGVEGKDFRRVPLDGAQRSGVLTQASVLTVSSYPTRTSPVLRGKWILENILNAPPPPPPPGLANVNEEAIGATETLRQQLEKHRSQAMCASCHGRMDPLGFGLENYDAIGAWRTRDGKFPIDSVGTLPGGKSFRTPGDLKAILKTERMAFAQCLTEKMLTYALGRGLERYDKKAVDLIVRRLALNGYHFSRLAAEIVHSMPFQMRRGEGGKR